MKKVIKNKTKNLKSSFSTTELTPVSFLGYLEVVAKYYI